MTYLWVACFNTQKRPTLLCLASHEKGPKLLECAKYINLTHAYTHKKRNALRLRGGFGFCTLISARCYDWLFLTSDQVCFSRKSKKKKQGEFSPRTGKAIRNHRCHHSSQHAFSHQHACLVTGTSLCFSSSASSVGSDFSFCIFPRRRFGKIALE